MKAEVTIDGVELDVSDLDHLEGEEYVKAVDERIKAYLVEELGADPDSLEVVSEEIHSEGGIVYDMRSKDKRVYH